MKIHMHLMSKARVSIHAWSAPLLLCVSASVFGETTMQQHSEMEESAMSMSHGMHRPSHHAPIGIIGGNYHKKGEFMFSIQLLKTDMQDNNDSGERLSDEQIISLPHPYGMEAAAINLSVVPESMDMNMAMIEGMYGVSDRFTLMVMAMYSSKDMNLNTYSSMGDRPLLGAFSSGTSGLSSLSLSSLIRIKETEDYRFHAEIGFEKSVGDNDKEGEVLSPMNMRMDARLPYAMQTGDKSTSFISAITFVKRSKNWVYGSQLRLKNSINTEEWNFGNSRSLNMWFSRDFSDQLSWSVRGSVFSQNPVKGRDPMIMSPVQTSNPDNYGGEVFEIGLGLNKVMGIGQGNNLSFELAVPLKQNLNGPQMERSYSFNAAFRKMF